MPEACHLLVNRLLGMPAAPLFEEGCNSNDICELFIGNQLLRCSPYETILVLVLRRILQDFCALESLYFNMKGQS